MRARALGDSLSFAAPFVFHEIPVRFAEPLRKTRIPQVKIAKEKWYNFIWQ
jgi:hypothetical protein